MLISFKDLSTHFHVPLKGVIHIGAHEAEELNEYLNLGINEIIWVEANPKLIQKLKTLTSKHKGSSVYCFAAYHIDGEMLDLNVANNGQSSSILEFGTHLQEHPHVHYVEKIQTHTKKIDSLIEELNFERSKFNFINIDIQGAELTALMGMQKQLECINYVYLEVNEKPLYVGCALLHEIDDFLKKFGFERKIIKMTEHGWGDAFYAKK